MYTAAKLQNKENSELIDSDKPIEVRQNGIQHLKSRLFRSTSTAQIVQLAGPGRKLILHFDARNTVFVADLGSRIPVEHALNTYIAGVIWGHLDEDGKWIVDSKEPSLCAPFKGAISWYKYNEQKLVTIASDRATLREKLGNFTLHNENGKPFRHYFDDHLEFIRWKHSKMDGLTVTGIDGRLYHYILPSFFKLLVELSKSVREYCVILRTFGRDGPHFLAAVTHFIEGRHPDYPEKHNIKIDPNVQFCERQSDTGDLRYVYKNEEGVDVVLTTERAIYDHWNQSTGVIAVRDDFEYWRKNSYHYTASKPLWFENSEKEIQHIMFDDNVRYDEDDNILNLREFKTADDVHSVNVEPHDACNFDNIYFVQADLLDSTGDHKYFIRKICESENALCENETHGTE